MTTSRILAGMTLVLGIAILILGCWMGMAVATDSLASMDA